MRCVVLRLRLLAGGGLGAGGVAAVVLCVAAALCGAGYVAYRYRIRSMMQQEVGGRVGAGCWHNSGWHLVVHAAGGPAGALLADVPAGSRRCPLYQQFALLPFCF